jgi:hypothetical protein
MPDLQIEYRKPGRVPGFLFVGNMPKGGKLEAGLACIAKSMMLI